MRSCTHILGVCDAAYADAELRVLCVTPSKQANAKRSRAYGSESVGEREVSRRVHVWHVMMIRVSQCWPTFLNLDRVHIWPVVKALKASE